MGDAQRLPAQRERDRRHVLGRHALAKARFKIHQRRLGIRTRVKARDDLLGESDLDIPRIASAGDVFFPAGHRGARLKGKQFNIAPHQFVGSGHELAKLLLRRLGDADVIAQRLRHFVHAV